MEDMSIEQRRASQEKLVLETLQSYWHEATENAEEWQDRAEITWDMIHGRDRVFGDKDVSGEKNQGARIVGGRKRRRGGQSGRTRIHMNRVGLAQQQIKAQFKQGLMNSDKWLIVEAVPGLESEYMTDLEAKRAIDYMTRNSDLRASITDAIGIGAAENMFAVKLNTKIESFKGPGGKTFKKICTEVIPLNIFNFYCDATGGNLYKIYEVKLDKYKVLEMSSEGGKEKGKPFDKEKVERLKENKQEHKETEKNDNKGNDREVEQAGLRNTIILHEYWGTVLDKHGNIFKWLKEDGSEIELKNVKITVANQECLLDEPVINPRLNGNSPFVVGSVLRTNMNIYGRAPLFAGVEMNRAENRLMASIIDAALKAQYNVNVVKKHGLAKPDQIQGGLEPNQTILQNDNLAPGEKLIDSVKTGAVDPGSFQVLGEIQRSGAENMMSNEIQLSGAMPSKQVRATEIVQSSQTINGLFEAMAADIEDTFIEPLASELFCEFLTYADQVPDKDLLFIFGGNVERAEQFKDLSKSERFEELGRGFRFRGKGVRGAAHNARQAQTLVNLFSLMASNPLINDAFQRRGVDIVKLFDKVVSGLGLDMQEFYDEQVADFAKIRQLIQEQALANAAAQGQNVGIPGGQGANAPQNQGPSETEPGSGAGF